MPITTIQNHSGPLLGQQDFDDGADHLRKEMVFVK